MATKDTIQALLEEWTLNTDAVEFSTEVQLTTRTALAIAGVPAISKQFEQIASGFGVASPNPDWLKLRQAAIEILGIMIKRYEESASRKAPRTMRMQSRSIYGR